MDGAKQHSRLRKDLAEPINRYFHDPVAGWIVNVLKDTRVMPDQVTYTSILIGLASAYFFGIGTAASMMPAGILLEVVLILDCVDGQLARAKGCSSDWGRILDGIAGYISYLAVLFGIMIGLKSQYGALSAIGVTVILKAISYDYCKLGITTMLEKGYDGNQKEIFDTCQKIGNNPSTVLKIYFFYLRVQEFIFRGRWRSVAWFEEKIAAGAHEYELTPEQRGRFGEISQKLMVVWRWNGSDFPLFLLAASAVLGFLEPCLIPLPWFLALQYLMTMVYHLLLHKGL